MSSLLQTTLNELRSEASKAEETIFDGLVNKVDDVINTINESLFVNYFLPFFTGQRNDHPEWIKEWIAIAGTPSTPVKVVRDGTNEFLYYVPPILDTSEIVSHSGTSINSIVDKSNKYQIPALGAKYLFDSLMRKSQDLTTNLQNKNLAQWYYIFSLYNIANVNNQSSDSQSSGDLSDAFDI